MRASWRTASREELIAELDRQQAEIERLSQERAERDRGSAAILSLVDAVLLRALPYRDPSRLVIKMSNRYELEPRRRRHSWLLVPFEPRLAAIVGALAPAIWGIYLVSRGRLLSGASLLAVWMVAFGWFALFLQRRQFARVWITVPSAALVLIACVFIFFLVMRPG